MTTNPDARPEPIVIDTFEGEKVRFHRGKLPAITLEMGEGYPRGSHLFFRVEARVGPVKYDEITAKRDDRRGELIREHTLFIEEVGLLGAKTASGADPGVGGSASSGVQEEDLFGDEPDDCFYEGSELTVYHRGTCDSCYRRAPWYQPGVDLDGGESVSSEDFLEAAGYSRPADPALDEHEPGF